MKSLIITLWGVLVCISLSAQKKYKDFYMRQRTPNTELLLYGYNFTVEYSDDRFIMKRYYPPTKAITEYYTCTDIRCKTKDGLSYMADDKGNILTKGVYKNNEKVGEWIEQKLVKGTYANGLRSGIWIAYRADSTIHTKSTYDNGVLHGEMLLYDSLGARIKTIVFDQGIAASAMDDVPDDYEFEYSELLEVHPIFGDCEKEIDRPKLLKECSDQNLLQYIYSTLPYPKKARKLGVEGMAYVDFIVDKDGSVRDIDCFKGISPDIKNICVQLVQNMPKWSPGMVNGKPVRVRYTLPVQFKLLD